jgi:hypothetical protein
MLSIVDAEPSRIQSVLLCHAFCLSFVGSVAITSSTYFLLSAFVLISRNAEVNRKSPHPIHSYMVGRREHTSMLYHMTYCSDTYRHTDASDAKDQRNDTIGTPVCLAR